MIEIATMIYKQGKKLLDAKKMSITIEEIKDSVYATYFDRSSAHFASCLASLEAARNSNNPESEIRAAIHHLYDAFFSLYDLLDKTTKKKSVILGESIVDFVCYKEDVYVPCCKIAVLIYGMYIFLGEEKNADIWYEYMMSTYKEARWRLNYGIEAHEISESHYDCLKRLNKKYVRSRPGYEYKGRMSPRGPVEGGPIMRRYITDEGINYTISVKTDLKNRIDNALNNDYIMTLDTE